LAWPFVVAVSIVAFHRPLVRLIERTREFEGPGDVKIKLDAAQVEKIMVEARHDNLSAEAVTKRIVEEAVIDEREFRILRGLLGESEGRSMHAYQTAFYRPALEELEKKKWITRAHGKFKLSAEGLQVLRPRLVSLLESPR